MITQSGGARPKNTYDVVIIGAGPAGSTAAYILAANGFKVLIVDKSAFPRDKLCGGLLTFKSIQLLEEVFSMPLDMLKSRQLINFQSCSFKVGNSTGACVNGQLNYPFHFVRRKDYDLYWLNMARAAGAEFKAADSVIALDPIRNQITTAKGQHYIGEVIFGADGALSRTRRWLSIKSFIEPNWKSGLAATLEVQVPNRRFAGLPHCPAIYFGHIPWGYAWSFPGDRYRNLGVVGLSHRGGKHLKTGFASFLERFNISQQDLPAIRSHALPYGNYLSQPGYNKVLLLGDACGLADPLLGEGIYYAHKSAVLAAGAVMKSFSRPQDILTRYSHDLIREVIAELKVIRLARQILFSMPANWKYKMLACLLRGLPRLCEETVQGQRSYRWFRPLPLDNKKRSGNSKAHSAL